MNLLLSIERNVLTSSYLFLQKSKLDISRFFHFPVRNGKNKLAEAVYPIQDPLQIRCHTEAMKKVN